LRGEIEKKAKIKNISKKMENDFRGKYEGIEV